MNKSRIDHVLAAVAAKNNVSVDEVTKEMEKALLYAYTHQTKVSHKFWNRVSRLQSGLIYISGTELHTLHLQEEDLLLPPLILYIPQKMLELI